MPRREFCRFIYGRKSCGAYSSYSIRRSLPKGDARRIEVSELETTRSQFLASAARYYLNSLAVSAVEAAVQQAVENIGGGAIDHVDHIWVNAAAERVLEESW